MKRLQEIIDGAKRVVFFGGAGVSTEIVPLVHTKKRLRKQPLFFSASYDVIGFVHLHIPQMFHILLLRCVCSCRGK